MSFKTMENKPVCSKCESTDSMYWGKEKDETLCENCNEDLIAKNLAKELMQHEIKIEEDDEEEVEEREIKEEVESEMSESDKENRAEEEEDEEDDNSGPVVRRSIRATLNKYRNPELEPLEPIERSRRYKVFRRTHVYKSPTATATCVTSKYVFHRGLYYQLGDIVAIVDSHGRGVYYAQITGLMTDEYCNKSATIQWLLPTKESPNHNVAFDPRTYYLGYVEDWPRSLDCMVPIMHAPSDYYLFSASPYPPVTPPPEIARYVWRNMDRVYIRRAP